MCRIIHWIKKTVSIFMLTKIIGDTTDKEMYLMRWQYPIFCILLNNFLSAVVNSVVCSVYVKKILYIPIYFIPMKVICTISDSAMHFLVKENTRKF